MAKQKSKQYGDLVRNDRLAWAREQKPVCMICGDKPTWPPLQVHEIERKSHAPNRWAHRCNFLVCCEPCHAGALATMPHALQLAYKMLKDRTHYNLDAWLRLRDPGLKAPNRVTQREVDLALAGLVRV